MHPMQAAKRMAIEADYLLRLWQSDKLDEDGLNAAIRRLDDSIYDFDTAVELQNKRRRNDPRICQGPRCRTQQG